jgi:alginate O-acetyltransferase complex protein AlgI
MLFNSIGFLFAFLPITVIGFFLLAKRNQTLAAGWLAAASLFFYGWWDYRYIYLLLISISVNFWFSHRIRKNPDQPFKKYWLVTAIAANLILLGYYKYADFFLSSASAISGVSLPLLNIVLPIGISFFTFTQIAFLVDTYQGKVKEYRFIHYILFVTYFPHLIAGPVLHHGEMMPQFSDKKTYSLSATNFAVGLTIFCIGLAKKVLIADNLSPYANDVFNAPNEPTLLIAWGGVLAYTFQLYFDFSGYSDMAIGLSRLFGIRLPLNFHSPYKAANISEFWRRWHMTLSRFLRDYLYIPLGGNRRGGIRRYSNLMVTMVLGGLWHGAGWNFAIWGALHGLYLGVNHAWIALANRIGFTRNASGWKVLATILTFLAVCLAWVFFRAADVATSIEIITGMFGGFGIALPDIIGNRLGGIRLLLENNGISFYPGGGARFVDMWCWVLAATLIAFCLPNTHQILRRYDPALDYDASTDSGGPSRIIWSPSVVWSISIGILLIAGLLSLNRPSEFLYFQF